VLKWYQATLPTLKREFDSRQVLQVMPVRNVEQRRKKSEYHKRYYAANKDKRYGEDLKKHYGITLEDYNEMFSAQDGKCAICSGGPNGEKRLCVDHCHSTGKVRGLLCDKCNVGLGRFNDDLALLEKAIEYLKK
jgi:hypothetical protein